MNITFIKKCISLLTALSITIIFTLLSTGFAQALQRSSKITTSVKPKSLVLTVPGSINMNEVEVSSVPTETTAALQGIEVADLRGKKMPLGWSLTITATDFASSDNDKISVSQLALEINEYVFESGKDGGIKVPGRAHFQDSNSDGVSDAITALTAAPGNGGGKFKISPVIKLLVPPFTVAGDYQSTLTLTLS